MNIPDDDESHKLRKQYEAVHPSRQAIECHGRVSYDYVVWLEQNLLRDKEFEIHEFKAIKDNDTTNIIAEAKELYRQCLLNYDGINVVHINAKWEQVVKQLKKQINELEQEVATWKKGYDEGIDIKEELEHEIKWQRNKLEQASEWFTEYAHYAHSKCRQPFVSDTDEEKKLRNKQRASYCIKPYKEA